MSGPQPICNCSIAQSRRRIQREYYKKNKKKVLAQNAKSKAKREIDLSPEVSDEELDRRALMLNLR